MISYRNGEPHTYCDGCYHEVTDPDVARVFSVPPGYPGHACSEQCESTALATAPRRAAPPAPRPAGDESSNRN